MTGRKAWALILIAGLAIGLAACKKRPNTDVTANPNEQVLFRSHDQRPGWVQVQHAEQGAYFYATGLSDRFSTELDARDHALLKARQEIADYILGLVRTEHQESRTRTNSAGDGFDNLVEGKSSLRTTAKVAVSQLRPKEWYLEKILTENNKVYWSAIVLAEVPRDVVLAEIRRVARALNTYEAQDKTFPLELKTQTNTAGAEGL